MECDVEYKTSPPDEYEYVYPRELEGIYLYLSMINIILILFMLLFLFKSYLCISIKKTDFYEQIDLERYPRPMEVEGEDKH